MSYTVLLPFQGQSIYATQLTANHSYVNVTTGQPGSSDVQDHIGHDASAYDFGLANGKQILALGNGVVVASVNVVSDGDNSNSRGISDPYGNFVTIQYDLGNGNTLFATYAHLMHNSGLAIGSEVHAGLRIGNVGLTGRTGGPHLHIQFGLSLTSATTTSTYVDPITGKGPQKADAGSSNDLVTFGDSTGFLLNSTYHENEYTFSSSTSLAGQVHAQTISLSNNSFSTSGVVGTGFGTATWNGDDYYSFLATSNGTLSVHLGGVSKEIDLRLLDPSGVRLNQSINNGPVAQDMTQNVTAGQTYLIHIDPLNYDSSNYSLVVSFQPATSSDTTVPLVSSPTLTVPQNSGPTAIGISAPSDNDSSLTIRVMGLPSDGAVLLSDGVTAVTQGELLTDAQLTGLKFKPTANISGQSSVFSYTVTDTAGNIATGNVTLAITSGNTFSGNLVGTNTVQPGTTATINSAVFLDHDSPGGVLRNAILENKGTIHVAAGGSVTSDGFTGDTVINDAGATFALDAATTFEFFPTFQNAGNLVVSAGSGNVAEITSFLQYAGVAFNNTGTVDVRSGTFNVFQGGSSGASGFSVASGATFLVTGGSAHPAFTFSGGTYSVAGTTQVGDNRDGQLTFAAGTTVNAANRWVVDGTLDLSTATISGVFSNLQVSTAGTGRLLLGTHDVTLAGLKAFNGFDLIDSGTVTLTGSGSIVNTNNDGGAISSGFFSSGTVHNLGTTFVDHEALVVGVVENDGIFNFSGGGLLGGTINNHSGATISLTGSSLGGTINNAGTLVLDGTAHAVSINGFLTNTGVIKQAGTIYFNHGFSNLGTIQNFNASGSAIALAADSGIARGDAETLGQGDIASVSQAGNSSASNVGLILGFSGLTVDPTNMDDITLTNDGIIVGTGGVAVQFGVGNDRLILDPFAGFDGIVDGGGGTNAIELTTGASLGILTGLGTSFSHFSTIQIDAGATWQLDGTTASQPNVINDGTIVVDGMTLALGAIAADSGQVGIIDVANGGTLELQHAVTNSQLVNFTGGGGLMKLDDPLHFNGTITNFSSGDTIELVGISATSATVSGSTMTILESNGASLTYNVSSALEGSYATSNDAFGNSFVAGLSVGSVSINDATITEGNSGTKLETFTVTRTGGTAAFDVNFATSDNSATVADNDYVAKAGLLHFDTGVNTQTISVTVNGDTKVEAHEAFFVNLSGATNGATISDSQGTGTIFDDDGAPVHDFSGDGKSDILWRHDNGTVVSWDINDSHILGTNIFAEEPSDWKIAGSGDFNGDGRADVLWHNDNGLIATWDMNDSQVLKVNVLGQEPNEWKIAGTGDFNGDGKADILWRHDNGLVATWDINDGQILGVNVFPQQPNDWKIAGTGDFNGDGKADILWRNDNGLIATWDMNGSQVLSVNVLGQEPTEWKIAGTGDFNGDHKADILWRHDNGTIATWDMNDSQILNVNVLGQEPTQWKIAGIGDFSGDGKADILWRHDNGTVVTWDMNDGQIASLNILAQEPNDWHIIA